MKVRTTHDGARCRHVCVTFKCDMDYFDAVYAGAKTAEVRVLDREEWSRIGADRTEIKQITLTTPDEDESVTFDVTWYGEIGQFAGRYVVLFCWRPDESER